jgi:hypothetical protein
MLAEPPTSRADLTWRMLRLPIRVNPWFWVAAVVTGWVSPSIAEALALSQLDVLLVWTATLLVAILVHELGHALIARAFGARDGRIVLYSLGGKAIHSGALRRWQRVLVSLAGPGAGFALYGLVFAASRLIGLQHLSPLAMFSVFAAEQICLFWGLVNLLPVYPLDGGQVAHELIVSRRPHDGALVAHQVSIAVALLAAVVCAYVTWAGIYSIRLGVALFGWLALANWFLIRQLRAGHGAEVGGWDGRPRDAWEQDPDWWKGS